MAKFCSHRTFIDVEGTEDKTRRSKSCPTCTHVDRRADWKSHFQVRRATLDLKLMRTAWIWGEWDTQKCSYFLLAALGPTWPFSKHVKPQTRRVLWGSSVWTHELLWEVHPPLPGLGLPGRSMIGHGTLRRQVQWHFLVLLHLRTWGPDLGCLSNQASKLLERSEKVEDPAQPMLEFLEPGSLPVDRLRTCVAGQSHQNLGRVQLSLKRLRQQSCEKKTGVSWTLLLGARTLLGAPGLTTRNKKLTQVGAPKRRPVGMAPFHVFVQRAQAHRSAAMDTLTSHSLRSRNM